MDKKPTVPYLVQQWLKDHAHRHVDGKVMLRVIANDLGLTRYNVASRLKSMVKLGYIVHHGRGVISMGEVQATPQRVYKWMMAEHMPKREKVAKTTFDQRYVIHQLEHGPMPAAEMRENFGTDAKDEKSLRSVYYNLSRWKWITLTTHCDTGDSYELTALGLKVAAVLGEVEADEEKERQERRAGSQKEPQQSVVPRLRGPQTGRAGQSAAARLAEPLHR